MKCVQTKTLTPALWKQRRMSHDPSWCFETCLDGDRYLCRCAGHLQSRLQLWHLHRWRHAWRLSVPAPGGVLMSLRSLPEAPTMARPRNYQWDAPSDVLAKWAETAPMAAAKDARSIGIFGVIGEDPWTGGGVTARRISAALRSIGKHDVTVRITSPGGDMFEGIAIYNL